MSQVTRCAYCEDPVPDERKDAFCDDRCKDLFQRSQKVDPTRPAGRSFLKMKPTRQMRRGKR